MRRPFSEFDPTKSRVLLWVVACLVLVMLVVYATWGCGPSEPSTGRLDLESPEDLESLAGWVVVPGDDSLELRANSVAFPREVEVGETTGTVFSDEVLEADDDPIEGVKWAVDPAVFTVTTPTGIVLNTGHYEPSECGDDCEREYYAGLRDEGDGTFTPTECMCWVEGMKVELLLREDGVVLWAEVADDSIEEKEMEEDDE